MSIQLKQYETYIQALADYYRTSKAGLGADYPQKQPVNSPVKPRIWVIGQAVNISVIRVGLSPKMLLAAPMTIKHQPLQSIIDEYFFVSLFHAYADGLECDHSSRLAAIQLSDESYR